MENDSILLLRAEKKFGLSYRNTITVLPDILGQQFAQTMTKVFAIAF